MLAYLVREHNKTSQTTKIREIRTKRTKKKTTRVLKNVMQEDQRGCKKNMRAEEGQMTAARTKQHEDEEEDTGKRPNRTKDERSSEECDTEIICLNNFNY